MTDTTRYTCRTCHAGYVPSWAAQRGYVCHCCGGRLRLRTELDDERDRTRALRGDRLANAMQAIMCDAYLALDGEGPEFEAAYAELDAVAEAAYAELDAVAVRQHDRDRLIDLAAEVGALKRWGCDGCGCTVPAPPQRKGWTRLPPGWLALDDGIECLCVLACSLACAARYDAEQAQREEMRRRAAAYYAALDAGEVTR